MAPAYPQPVAKTAFNILYVTLDGSYLRQSTDVAVDIPLLNYRIYFFLGSHSRREKKSQPDADKRRVRNLYITLFDHRNFRQIVTCGDRSAARSIGSPTILGASRTDSPVGTYRPSRVDA
jgi:hypothetical protein